MTIAVDAGSAGVVWGKWDGGASYPLIGHLLDTAAFASAIWDANLSVTTQHCLKDGFATGGFDEARQAFAFVAAAHDCGKADPWFQGQVATPRAIEFAANAQLLAARGLSGFPEVEQLLSRMRTCGDDSIRRLLRHEAGSAIALEHANAPTWAVAAVSGHHGRYMPDSPPRRLRPVSNYRDWVASSDWAKEQQQALDVVAGAIGWSGFAGNDGVEDSRAPIPRTRGGHSRPNGRKP